MKFLMILSSGSGVRLMASAVMAYNDFLRLQLPMV